MTSSLADGGNFHLGTEPHRLYFSYTERFVLSLPDSFHAGRVMIVAFEGWNDAGDAASAVLKHFREQLEIESVTEFHAEEYFDYQFNRPVVRINEDGERELIWPSVTFTVVNDPDSEQSLVILQGTEPSRSWMSFSEEVLEIATELRVGAIIFLGALLADVPHTRSISLFTSSDDAEIREELDLPRSSYEGPVGILSVIADVASDHGIPSLSVWASVPHYVHHPPSPKVTLALVQKLQDLLGIQLDNSDLISESNAWESTVDAMSQEDEELAQYIRQLEKARDTVDAPEASGEAIAQEFEKYLRLNEGDDPREGPRRAPEN